MTDEDRLDRLEQIVALLVRQGNSNSLVISEIIDVLNEEDECDCTSCTQAKNTSTKERI